MLPGTQHVCNQAHSEIRLASFCLPWPTGEQATGSMFRFSIVLLRRAHNATCTAWQTLRCTSPHKAWPRAHPCRAAAASTRPVAAPGRSPPCTPAAPLWAAAGRAAAGKSSSSALGFRHLLRGSTNASCPLALPAAAAHPSLPMCRPAMRMYAPHTLPCAPGRSTAGSSQVSQADPPAPRSPSPAAPLCCGAEGGLNHVFLRAPPVEDGTHCFHWWVRGPLLQLNKCTINCCQNVLYGSQLNHCPPAARVLLELAVLAAVSSTTHLTAAAGACSAWGSRR